VTINIYYHASSLNLTYAASVRVLVFVKVVITLPFHIAIHFDTSTRRNSLAWRLLGTYPFYFIYYLIRRQPADKPDIAIRKKKHHRLEASPFRSLTSLTGLTLCRCSFVGDSMLLVKGRWFEYSNEPTRRRDLRSKLKPP
jgi:hypothetical protein